MIRFKDFLFEDEDTKNFGSLEDAKKFLELIRTGEWIIPQKKGTNLYRGTDNSVVLGVKEEYEGGRDPMNTKSSTQDVVDTITEARYPDWPQRGKSRFASTFRRDAKTYGTVHYVFPRKGSKIVSFPRDVYVEYFGHKMKGDAVVRRVRKINDSTKEGFFDLLTQEFGESVSNIVEGYYKGLTKRGLEVLRKVCEEMSLKAQKERIEDVHEKVGQNERFRKMGFAVFRDVEEVLLKLKENFIGKLIEYFEGGEKGIKSRYSEVAIQGDILHAQPDFVNNFCTFDGEEKRWKLKDVYKKL